MTRIFQRRVRGFRVIEVIALVVLLATVLSVYLSKTGAINENADIVRVEDEITAEQDRLKLLNAEVAYLEQPERIERLSSQFLGLAPISAKREAEAEALPELARAAEPPPAPAPAKPAAAAPAPAPAPEAAAPIPAEAPQ